MFSSVAAGSCGLPEGAGLLCPEPGLILVSKTRLFCVGWSLSDIRGELPGFLPLVSSGGYATENIWGKLSASSKGLGLHGRSMGCWHKPTAADRPLPWSLGGG